MKLRVSEAGEIILSDVFNAIGIETDAGLFGIAQRDSGIEVTLDDELGLAFDGDPYGLLARSCEAPRVQLTRTHARVSTAASAVAS